LSERLHHHIVPLSVYVGIGLTLFTLTIVTVAVSFIDLGGFNVVVALLVAAFKASLVALIYMHLKYDKKIYAVVFILAILFLALFIVLTMFDVATRGSLDEQKAGPIKEDAVIYDVPTADSTVGVATDSVGAAGQDTTGGH